MANLAFASCLTPIRVIRVNPWLLLPLLLLDSSPRPRAELEFSYHLTMCSTSFRSRLTGVYQVNREAGNLCLLPPRAQATEPAAL